MPPSAQAARAQASRPPTVRLKVVTTGPHMCGKSCLIKQFCESRFVKRYLPTIGVDYGVRPVDLGGVPVRVNFFDLSGHESYLEVRREFYADTQALIVVFDYSDAASVAAAEGFYREAVDNGFQPSSASAFVVGTKADLERQVTDEQAEALARKCGGPLFRCSAASGEGVADSLNAIFKAALARATKGK